jgi:hypothetical protein
MKKSRREFLKNSVAVTAMGIGAAKFGMLRATLAAARMQGKQPLNERNLNSIIPKDPAEYANWIKGPSGDLKAWVREKFQLTADQDRAINSLTSAQINKVKDILKDAATKKAKLSVAFAPGIVITKDLDVKGQVKAGSSDVAVRKATRETTEPAPTNGTPGGSETTFEAEFTSVPPSIKIKITCKKTKWSAPP